MTTTETVRSAVQQLLLILAGRCGCTNTTSDRLFVSFASGVACCCCCRCSRGTRCGVLLHGGRLIFRRGRHYCDCLLLLLLDFRANGGGVLFGDWNRRCHRRRHRGHQLRLLLFSLNTTTNTITTSNVTNTTTTASIAAAGSHRWLSVDHRRRRLVRWRGSRCHLCGGSFVRGTCRHRRRMFVLRTAVGDNLDVPRP